jgi:hypothetical protein
MAAGMEGVEYGLDRIRNIKRSVEGTVREIEKEAKKRKSPWKQTLESHGVYDRTEDPKREFFDIGIDVIPEID